MNAGDKTALRGGMESSRTKISVLGYEVVKVLALVEALTVLSSNTCPNSLLTYCAGARWTCTGMYNSSRSIRSTPYANP